MHFLLSLSRSILFLSSAVSLLLQPSPVASDVVVDPVPAATRPDRISTLPIYSSFFDEPELYRRAHVFLMGLNGTKELGLSWWLNSPEAYTTVKTYGPDTGSEDYFPIGEHTFGVVESADDYEEGYLFEWDAKQLLLYKTSGTEGISFTVKDEDPGNDDLLMHFNLSAADFPAVGEGYKEYRMKSEVDSAYDETEGADLVFRIKVTEMSIPTVPEEKVLNMSHNFSSESYPGIEYDEHILDLNETGAMHDFQNGTDRALVLSWRHVDFTDVEGAVLWVIGRNDAFSHPHVFERLFFGPNSLHKLDVYMLHWRLNGLAMHRGFLTDAYYYSHNAYSDFDVYNEEMRKALALMKSLGPSAGGDYPKVIGYGHSTGGTILSNFLRTDDGQFDGIILNSPFYDWADTSVNEFSLGVVVPVLEETGVWDTDDIVKAKSTPEAYADDPVIYLRREVVMSAWAVRILVNHPRPWSWRSVHSGIVTVGFVKGASDAFKDLEGAAPIAPMIPVLVLCSEQDDVLDGRECGELSKWVSESRELVLFRYNGHDVFLSPDEEDEAAAIDAFGEWLNRTLAASDGVNSTEAPTVEVPSQSPSGMQSTSPSTMPMVASDGSNSTEAPTDAPTKPPTDEANVTYSEVPSQSPSGMPSTRPSTMPTVSPSVTPTGSSEPSHSLSGQLSDGPSTIPTMSPSAGPTGSVESSTSPSGQLSNSPSSIPTMSPSAGPVGTSTSLASTVLVSVDGVVLTVIMSLVSFMFT